MKIDIQELINRAIDNSFHTTIESRHPRPRFCYPFSKGTISQLLSDSYRAEVEARGVKIQDSPEISQRLASVAEYLTNPQRKPSLLLYGGMPGTGKTTTVRAIVHTARMLRESVGSVGINRLQGQLQTWLEPETIQEFGRLENAVKVPLFCNALEISRLIASDKTKYDAITCCPFLVIDDIGTEPLRMTVYGNEFFPLVELISCRYDKQLPTILTTNLSLNAIGDMYGPRIEDRLREMCEMIAFNSPESFRK